MLTALLLRRINVTGSHMTMAALRTTLEAAGYPSVKTILASGNVVVESNEPVDIRSVERVIEDRHGFYSEIFSRSQSEIRQISIETPFDSAQGKIEIAFLQESPSVDTIEEITALATGRDTLRVIGREIHWFRPLPLEPPFPKERDLRRALGADNTRRTLNTVNRIASTMEGWGDGTR